MNDVPHVVVIYAPAAAGKTTNAEALAKVFGCTSIVDDWNGHSPLPIGALALTNVPPSSEAYPGLDARRHWLRRLISWIGATLAMPYHAARASQ